MKFLIWFGMLGSLTQASLLSGLNLAVFGIGRLRLEVEAAGGSRSAHTVLELRKDSNSTLATILWGNVAFNVLLTLLAKSVLAGVTAFFLSTFVITWLGEIAPQAYFSRHALRTAARLAPLLRTYGILLYPVAKPTALILDWWLGSEAVTYLRERDFRALIAQQMKAAVPEIGVLEGTGALNFLDLDDIPIGEEGEELDPRSVIALPMKDGMPVFPPFGRSAQDSFLQSVYACEKKWMIIADPSGRPCAALDARRFLLDALLGKHTSSPSSYLHRTIVATDARTPLGKLIGQLRMRPRRDANDVIDEDVILLWGRQKRIVTGADLLGRLLRGIAQRSVT
jgi:metal transporter CNNM